jgi:hypothetical protein
MARHANKPGKRGAPEIITPARRDAQRALMDLLEKPYDLKRWYSFRTALVKYADQENIKLDKAYDKVANL